jgi:Ca2+-binding EF-hand superfamily protein
MAMFRFPNREERDRLWVTFDYNGGGTLSFGEVAKAVRGLWPQKLDSAPALQQKLALMKAFRAADADDSGLLQRREFAGFLKYLAHYASLWDQFDKLDADGSGKLSQLEFIDGCNTLGMGLSRVAAAAAFNIIDGDSSGSIHFDEFVEWAIQRKCARDHRDMEESPAPQPWDKCARGDTPPAFTGPRDVRHRLVAIPAPTLPPSAFARTQTLATTSDLLASPNASATKRRTSRRKRTLGGVYHSMGELAGKTYTTATQHRHNTVPSHFAHRVFMGHTQGLGRARVSHKLPELAQWPPQELPTISKPTVVQEAERRWNGEWQRRARRQHSYGRAPERETAELRRSWLRDSLGPDERSVAESFYSSGMTRWPAVVAQRADSVLETTKELQAFDEKMARRQFKLSNGEDQLLRQFK